MNWRSLILVACLGMSAFPTVEGEAAQTFASVERGGEIFSSAEVGGFAPATRRNENFSSAGWLSVSQLQQLARAITVKVFSGDTWGSGIVIQKQGQVYTVVTNDHVLVAGNAHRIQTSDGRVYSARVIKGDRFGGNDLGVLQFNSTAAYTVATLAASSSLQVGDEVLAAGFPIEGNPGFSLAAGQISLLPEKALEQGYQLAYTNDIQKGMSGGPLLNQQGQVVGINGMHAYPLWGDPYVFQDGSLPCPAMRDVMVKSSWAIPIETLARSLPRLSLPAVATPARSPFACSDAAQSQPNSQPIIVAPAAPNLQPEPLW